MESSCWATKWRGWGYVPCDNKAKVERNGKGYCGIHDPVAIKLKNDKRRAESAAKYEAQREAWRRGDLEHAVCEKVSVELLQALANRGGLDDNIVRGYLLTLALNKKGN